jgi:hypothetical protein
VNLTHPKTGSFSKNMSTGNVFFNEHVPGHVGDLVKNHHYPWSFHFKHSHWWTRQSRSELASHYAWGTNGVKKWMQDGRRLYVVSYMVSNGSCCMVTWTIFKNHFLEVGLTQNWETMAPRMALRTSTTVDLLCFITCEDLHEQKFIEIAFGPGAGHIRLHTFFWALTIYCSWLLACVWSGPISVGRTNFLVKANLMRVQDPKTFSKSDQHNAY